MENLSLETSHQNRIEDQRAPELARAPSAERVELQTPSEPESLTAAMTAAKVAPAEPAATGSAGAAPAAAPVITDFWKEFSHKTPAQSATTLAEFRAHFIENSQ